MNMEDMSNTGNVGSSFSFANMKKKGAKLDTEEAYLSDTEDSDDDDDYDANDNEGFVSFIIVDQWK